MLNNASIGSNSNLFHTWLYSITPWLVAVGFLLLLGGLGVSLAASMRLLNGSGRGETISRVVAGMGAALTVLGIVLGQII